jgi:uncharacterized membrane protein
LIGQAVLVRELAGPLILALVAALAVGVTIWLWRDMRERQRPVWLRVLVVVTGCVSGLGIILWIIDLARHPHRHGLTRRQIVLQEFD